MYLFCALLAFYIVGTFIAINSQLLSVVPHPSPLNHNLYSSFLPSFKGGRAFGAAAGFTKRGSVRDNSVASGGALSGGR